MNPYGASTEINAPASPEAAGPRQEQTIVVEIFMAGDVAHARQVIRKFCMDFPCCVTLATSSYIYRGGEEDGFVIAFRNYPRFPADKASLVERATALAERLRGELAQRSYMVVEAGGVTTWSTDDA